MFSTFNFVNYRFDNQVKVLQIKTEIGNYLSYKTNFKKKKNV